MTQTNVLIIRKVVSRSWNRDVEIENMTKLDFASSLNFSSSFFYLSTFLYHVHHFLHDVFFIITTMSCNTKFWISKACFWHDSTRFWDLHHVVNLTYVEKWSRSFVTMKRILSFNTKRWMISNLNHRKIANKCTRFFLLRSSFNFFRLFARTITSLLFCHDFSIFSFSTFSLIRSHRSYFVTIFLLLIHSYDHIALILSWFFIFINDFFAIIIVQSSISITLSFNIVLCASKFWFSTRNSDLQFETLLFNTNFDLQHCHNEKK